jgi:hypothetical protein
MATQSGEHGYQTACKLQLADVCELKTGVAWSIKNMFRVFWRNEIFPNVVFEKI